jgi:hypothetical protein
MNFSLRNCLIICATVPPNGMHRYLDLIGDLVDPVPVDPVPVDPVPVDPVPVDPVPVDPVPVDPVPVDPVPEGSFSPKNGGGGGSVTPVPCHFPLQLHVHSAPWANAHLLLCVILLPPILFYCLVLLYEFLQYIKGIQSF